MDEVRPLSVLFVQPKLSGTGGIERVVPGVAKALFDRGYKVMAASFYDQVAVTQSCWSASVTINESKSVSWFHRLGKLWQRAKFLRVTIRTLQPEVLIVSARGTCVLVMFLKMLRLVRRPVLLYVHEGLYDSGRFQARLSRLMYRQADGFICVSQGVLQEVRRDISDRIPAVCAYNAVSESFTETNNLPALGGQSPYFITTSRIETIKGVDVLVALFSNYCQDNKGTLLILGEGSLRVELTARVAAAGLQERIVFLGHQTDVSAYLKVADVYVSCARSESFGLSLVEALAWGLPVVATDVKYGPREILSGEVQPLSYPTITPYGILYAPFNQTKSFEDAVNEQQVLFNKALLHAVQIDSFEPAELKNRAGEFSVTKQIDAITGIISSVTV